MVYLFEVELILTTLCSFYLILISHIISDGCMFMCYALSVKFTVQH